MKLAFKTGITPWDWAIRFYSGGPFSHCEIIFSDGMWFSSRPITGVNYRRIIADDKWTIIDTPVTPEQEIELRKWADGEIGCKYDWLGIIWFLCRRIKPHPDRWFCSEICTTAMQKVGLLLNVEPFKMTPVELYELCGKMK